jgi:hypothetical protein
MTIESYKFKIKTLNEKIEYLNEDKKKQYEKQKEIILICICSFIYMFIIS